MVFAFCRSLPYASIYRSVRGLAHRGLVSLKQEWACGPISISLTPEGGTRAKQISDDLILTWKKWEGAIKHVEMGLQVEGSGVPPGTSKQDQTPSIKCSRCKRIVSISEVKQALSSGDPVICWCSNDLTRQAEQLLYNHLKQSE